MVKSLSTVRETRVQSLGWEDPLEKEMTIHFFLHPHVDFPLQRVERERESSSSYYKTRNHIRLETDPNDLI